MKSMTDTTSPGIAVRAQLSGVWRNELGSTLTLEADGEGALTGDFRSGTGAVAGRGFPVFGSYDPEPSGTAVVLGFVVDWTDVHCVTSWSGQYQPGDDSIRAAWLMTTETDVGDEWKATVVGHDVFRRVTPSSWGEETSMLTTDN